MAKTCIVCGGPAGSGEHLFPASLGGRRVNNGIYCKRHNNDYGALAAKLSNQLAFFNAQFRIRNTRTKQIQPVTLTDPASGATFEYDGDHLKPKEVRILSQDGNTATIAVTDKAQIQQFLDEQQAKGLTYRVSGRETRQTYHPGLLHIKLGFGRPSPIRQRRAHRWPRRAPRRSTRPSEGRSSGPAQAPSASPSNRRCRDGWMTPRQDRFSGGRHPCSARLLHRAYFARDGMQPAGAPFRATAGRGTHDYGVSKNWLARRI